MTKQLGLEARVQNNVQTVFNDIIRRHSASKSNSGRLVLEALIWDEIQKLAKGKSEDAWKRMEEEKVYEAPSGKEAGEFLVGVTPHYQVMAKVSAPVKRFKADELVEVLAKSKYKIPKHESTAFVDKSKVGEKGNVSLSIVAKQGDE